MPIFLIFASAGVSFDGEYPSFLVTLFRVGFFIRSLPYGSLPGCKSKTSFASKSTISDLILRLYQNA